MTLLTVAELVPWLAGETGRSGLIVGRWGNVRRDPSLADFAGEAVIDTNEGAFVKKKERKNLAETLIVLYYAYVFAQGKLRNNPNVPRLHAKSLKSLSASERKHFLNAADACHQLEADPRDFMLAQFQAFAEYSQHINKFMLPMPHQLSTLAALVRYQRYMGQQEMRVARKAPKVDRTTTKASHFREERRLLGLVRMNRCTPDDVLTGKPEEFSKEFLKHKGVWKLVRDVWIERTMN